LAKDIPEMSQILKKETVLKGTKVMTDDGKELGTMVDLSFDPVSGKVEGYEVSGGMFADAYTGRASVPAAETLSIGKDVAFVPASTGQTMENQVGGVKAAMQNAGDKFGEIKNSVSENGHAIVDSVSSKTQSASQSATSPEVKKKVTDGVGQIKDSAHQAWHTIKEKATHLKEKADQEMEHHRIKDALGRPVSRVIFDKSDNIILNTGDLITHKAIDQARDAGELSVLLDSIYAGKPEISPDQMRASSNQKEPA
jgi:sporulation protein YlmC with PRC-barrel domain